MRRVAVSSGFECMIHALEPHSSCRQEASPAYMQVSNRFSLANLETKERLQFHLLFRRRKSVRGCSRRSKEGRSSACVAVEGERNEEKARVTRSPVPMEETRACVHVSCERVTEEARE